MHQFGFSIWGYTTILSKIEKQNKQIKTFQVVLLMRPSVGGAGSVCVCGGGGGTYSLGNLPVCSMIICFIKRSGY